MAPNPEFVKKARTAKAAKPGGKSALGTAAAEKKPQKGPKTIRSKGGQALLEFMRMGQALRIDAEPWPIKK